MNSVIDWDKLSVWEQSRLLKNGVVESGDNSTLVLDYGVVMAYSYDFLFQKPMCNELLGMGVAIAHIEHIFVYMQGCIPVIDGEIPF